MGRSLKPEASLSSTDSVSEKRRQYEHIKNRCAPLFQISFLSVRKPTPPPALSTNLLVCDGRVIVVLRLVEREIPVLNDDRWVTLIKCFVVVIVFIFQDVLFFKLV